MMSDVDLIVNDSPWREHPGLTNIGYHDEDSISSLLLGHSVTRVADDHLLLDNGTVIKVVPNEGGCSCGGGDYEIADLGETDNIITSVEFEETDSGRVDGAWENQHYRVFVLAGDKRINLIDVEGDDGSGYYGTGYWLLVREVKS